MITISVANQKGGVGKTTTAVTLAALLAQRGKRTLIIDADPQGQVALSLGRAKSSGIFRVIVNGEPLGDCIALSRENLHILPGDKKTETANRYLSSVDYREHVLAEALEPMRVYMDYVIIDLAPSLSVLHIAALAASDWLLIPSRMDHLAADGVNEVMRTASTIQQNGGSIQGFSILPTFFDRTTRETYKQFSQLVGLYREKVLPPIPVDTKVREATTMKSPLPAAFPNCAAMRGYLVNGKRQGGYSQALDSLLIAMDVRP
jgi:chromosome partitioning protein